MSDSVRRDLEFPLYRKFEAPSSTQYMRFDSDWSETCVLWSTGKGAEKYEVSSIRDRTAVFHLDLIDGREPYSVSSAEEFRDALTRAEHFLAKIKRDAK